MEYKPIAPGDAYTLLNCGGVILVCTVSPDKRYNLAPVAWNCPLDYEPVSRVLFVIDPHHETFKNLEASREFALALPSYHQKVLVEKTGSVSGERVDKYQAFAIASHPAVDVDALIPDGVAGRWIAGRWKSSESAQSPSWPAKSSPPGPSPTPGNSGSTRLIRTSFTARGTGCRRGHRLPSAVHLL